MITAHSMSQLLGRVDDVLLPYRDVSLRGQLQSVEMIGQVAIDERGRGGQGRIRRCDEDGLDV